MSSGQEVGSCNGKTAQLQYELIPHLPYSSDLTPTSLLSVQKLKKLVRRPEFSINESVIIEAVKFDKNCFLEGMKKLESRWTKRIALERDYAEK